MGPPVRVMVWCTPRSISTAFAKCLTAIEGNEVWFEPYAFGHYAQTLVRSDFNTELPMEFQGAEAEELYRKGADLLSVISHSPVIPERLSFAWIKEKLEGSTSPYVFVKDMGMAMDTAKCRQYLPNGYRHTFLLRHPTLFFTSYRKAMYKQLLEADLLSQADAADERSFDIEKADRIMATGRMFLSCYELWCSLREDSTNQPIVIDSNDLLTRPAEILRRYCEAVGLPYTDSLLQWDASMDCMAAWTAASPNFYRDSVNFMHTAAHSTGFSPPKDPIPREELTDDVRRLSDAALPFYLEMYETRLR